jgi:branched-chain amino acid transport system ATP-binding protein
MKRYANGLVLNNLVAGYDSRIIIDRVTLTVEPGEICCIIGEEGAGKSTLVKALTRQIKAVGQVFFNRTDLTLLKTSQMVSHDIDFIVQGGNILNGFTVEQHVALALSSAKRRSQHKLAWQEINARFPQMTRLVNQVAGRLSGGERIILSMACMLATDASLLILDEPTAGLAPETCQAIHNFLLHLKEKGRTILLTEHNYQFAFGLADAVVTLRNGKLSGKYSKENFMEKDFVHENLYQISA